MRLTVLGSAGWMPAAGRQTSCYAVAERDRLLVLDAGTGLHRLVTEPALLDGVIGIDVVVSHFHLDHIIGLSYLSALDRPVTVHGPGDWLYHRPTAPLLDELLRPPYQPSRLSDRGVSVRELTEAGLDWAGHRLRVRHQVTHTAPSVAFRLDDALSYCTDTGHDLGNAEFARGCRLLLHEAWSTGDVTGTGHSSAAQAADIAARAGVRRLLLIHLPPARDPETLRAQAAAVFPATELAADGLGIDLNSPY
jgi:ribonuclease BN (tRNA processing enzyme)